MRQKLAIVGSGPKTRDDAPWNDNEYDIWVFNEAVESVWVKRFDASFQIHLPESYTALENFKDPHYWAWMQEKHGKPIFMQAPDDRVPDCEIYPLDEITKMADLEKPYLTGTPAMALALGILKGYRTIETYGVEMSYTEYRYQAECYRFWIGFAKGRGIKLDIHGGEYMLNARLYGYEGNHTFPSSFFQGNADKLDAEWSAAEKNFRGTQRTLDRLLATGEIDKVSEMVVNLQSAAMLAGQLFGRLKEAEKYASYTVDKPADRGEFEFSAAIHQRDGEASRTKMFQLSGQVEYVWNVWKQTKDNRALNQLKNLIAAFIKVASETGAHHGAYIENQSYIKEYDEMYISAGGQIGDNPRNVRL